MLETERLILRDFMKEDWQRVLEYQSELLSLPYYGWKERTPAAVQKFIDRMLDFQQERPRIKYQLAVVLKSTRELVGHCGVRMDMAGAVEADMGYELDPKHWNHGYITEAAQAMLDFGFHQLGVHRIWAGCAAENTDSAHVLEKLGMRLEGRFREHRYFKDRWLDSLIYAILQHEWQIHKQSHPVYWKEVEG